MTDAERVTMPAIIWGTVGAIVGLFLTPMNGGPWPAYVLGLIGAGIGALLGARIVRRRRDRW
jgi:hypothetical protein